MILEHLQLTPDLRHVLEPLVLDAVFEYGARLRATSPAPPDRPVTISIAQGLEIIAAQAPRWKDKLHASLATLPLAAHGLPRQTQRLLHDLLHAIHGFFRREGAATLQAACDTQGAEARFSLLWADLFSRCLLDWLREHDLIHDPERLDSADSLVECAKLWVRDLASLPLEGAPLTLLDEEREFTATLQRGPITLRLSGKPEPMVISGDVESGLRLTQFQYGDVDHAAVQAAQHVLLLLLIERHQGRPLRAGRLGFLCPGPVAVPAEPVISTEVHAAFEKFIGNEALVLRLKQKAAAARRLKKVHLHPPLLILGPVGHGKTTLARCLAKALGLPLVELQAASLSRPEDILHAVDDAMSDAGLKPQAVLDGARATQVQYPPLVIFIDDAHGARRRQTDLLAPLLRTEDRRLVSEAQIGDFRHATILAAATEATLVPELLLNACRRVELEPYRRDEVARMAAAHFRGSGTPLPEPLAQQLAGMSRCNPLRAHLYATELRDRHRSSPSTTPLTRDALSRLGHQQWKVDEHGLGLRDYQYLQALESGPKGLPALQHLLTFTDDELTTHIEPYLIQLGAVQRTSRGRALTVLGEHLLHRHRAKG